MNKPTTIYDVARVAGVSHQTVSRVLRGLQGMSDETRERVQQVAADLHYRPSVVARELASSRPSRIGVVGYETFESSTSKVLKGVNDVATAAGYVLDIVTVDPLGEVDEIARRLDAINGSDAAGLARNLADRERPAGSRAQCVPHAGLPRRERRRRPHARSRTSARASRHSSSWTI